MQDYKTTFLSYTKGGYYELPILSSKVNSLKIVANGSIYAVTINDYPQNSNWANTVYPGYNKTYKGKKNELLNGIWFINVFLWARFIPPAPPANIIVILKEFI